MKFYIGVENAKGEYVMENKKVTFGGWSTEDNIKGKYKELFDEVCNDDGCLTAISKETFEHCEPNENGDDSIWFKYKLAITVQSMHAFLAEDEEDYNKIHFELFMVPLPEYLHPKKLQDVASPYGITPEQVELRDIIDYGGCPILATDCISSPIEYYDVTKSEDIITKLDTCAYISIASNSTRGFALDRAWNAIGSTGWDLLHDMIEGDNFIQRTLNRYKEREVK